MRTALSLVLLALALALVAAFVTPARAQYVPHTADWWAAAADQADYEAMAAPSQAPWVPVGSLDYEYDVQGLEDTLGAGGADLSNYGNPNFGSGSVNFGDAYGAGADWNANLNLPVTSGGFGSGGFGSGGFGAGGSTKSAMPTFQAAMPTTMTKAQRVYAPQVLQTVQEQLPETTASPKYLQPVIKTHVIDQPVIQPKIVRQPIIQQRIVEQPVLRTRIVNQPVIRRIVTQPVLRPRIIQQTQYQPQYIDQPVVQPRIIEQTIVREQLMEKQQQNQPIVSAPLTSSKKGGASYQQQF